MGKGTLKLLSAGVIIGVILFFYCFPPIFYLLFGSFVFAYFLAPLVHHFTEKGLKRQGAIFLSYSIIGVLLLFLVFVVLPVFYRESERFFQNMQVFYDVLAGIWQWIATKASHLLSFSLVLDWQRDILPLLEAKIAIVMAATIDRFLSLPKNLAYLILSPVIAYYFLRDAGQIGGRLLTLFKPKHRSDVLILVKETDRVVRGFIRGNLLVSLAVAFVTTLGLWLIGLDYPLLMGFLAGIFDIIPYFGPILGAIPVVILALLQPEVNLFFVFLLLIGVQQLENIFISPKIIGDCVGLHPVTIILLVFVGGSVGGILGMVLIIPVAAIAKVLFIFFYERFVGYRFH